MPKQAQEIQIPKDASIPVATDRSEDGDDYNSDVDSTNGDGGVGEASNRNDNASMSDFEHWTDYSYVKPLRVIYHLSAYPTLTSICKIL